MTEPFDLAFTVPGNPIPKARPRVTLRPGRKPMAYTPARTKGWEATIADAARLAMGDREPFEGAVGVELWLWRADRRRADGDNMEKAVCDALNGLVWVDDDQVLEMHRYKVVDRKCPGIGIRVWAVKEKNLIQRGMTWVAEWIARERDR